MSLHYVDFGKKNNQLPSYVITGFIPQYKNHFSELLVMTGSSDNHALGSFNVLYSFLLSDPYCSLIYIDLGLSSEFFNILSAHFETLGQIQAKMGSNGFLAYRKFNWKSFPSWMNLYTNTAQHGGYSWKSIPITDAFFEWKGLFSWQDAGNVVTDGISREVSFARQYGMYACRSAGTISRWTYKDTRSFLSKNRLVKRNYAKDPNCATGSLYFDYKHEYIHDLMMKFKQCVYTQKCVSPRGSNMKNHRQEQAVMSMLINDYRIPHILSKANDFFPAFRNEESDTTQILYNLVKTMEQLYHIRLSNRIYDYSKGSYKTTALKYTTRHLEK